MHKVVTDIKKNRIYITLSGVLITAEVIKVREKIYEVAGTLQPGFDVINDLSKYIHGDDEAAPILQDIIRHLNSKKVKRIVRVVGPSNTALLQFAKYTQPIDGVTIKYLPTLEEAEAFLNDSE
jgi:hypothetical protein